MNAHPHSAPLAPEPEAPARPEASRFAHNLIQAAKTLVPQFEAGRPIGRVSEVVEIVWRRNLRVNQHPPNRRRQPPGRSRHEAEYR